MNVELNIAPRRAPYVVIGALIALYVALNFGLSYFPSGFISAYVIRPALWLALAYLVFRLPGYRAVAKLRLRKTIIILAVIVAVFQIGLSVVAGLFSSFGKSPYSFTPQGIIINLVFVGSMLAGMELSRAYLVNRLARRWTMPMLGLVALVYTVVSIPMTRLTGLTGLSEPLEIVTFAGSTGLPLLAENLLASFLALLAGPMAAIAYRGSLQAFEWFCPILPDLPWGLKALVGTVAPALGFMVVENFYSGELRPRPTRSRGKAGRSAIGWIMVAIIGVGLLWFSLGLLPLHPTTVISGSMRPAIDVGDVVITAQVPEDIISEGDIIEYLTEEATIIHRVVEIHQSGGSTLFITKGDANNSPDRDPVFPQQIRGKVVFIIPKIGWVPIILRLQR